MYNMPLYGSMYLWVPKCIFKSYLPALHNFSNAKQLEIQVN